MRKRNKFNLSHKKRLTCDMGFLIPLTWFSTLPGDTVRMSTQALLRMSPLVAPLMHEVRVRIHNWFVPLRLIWDGFESFITGGEDGLDATVAPYRDLNTVDYSGEESGLIDYMGIPPLNYTGTGNWMSMLPFRAYNLIYNENYRDQDLQTERALVTTDGSDGTTAVGSLAPVCWSKDYFTSARTSPQKGADVIIPLGDDAPVYGIGKAGNQNFPTAGLNVYETNSGGLTSYANASGMDGTNADEQWYVEGTAATGGDPAIYADLSAVSGVDINDLRLALQLQKIQEARARYGSRYTEWLRYHGVRSSDARLQRPEYLGGGKQIIQFSEVLNHSDTDTGSMAGHGITGVRTPNFIRFFEEHGIVLSLMSILPDTVYTQGMHREFNKSTKEDYFTPELQNIGDQQILCKEIYVNSADPSDTFGYVGRYDEYRSIPSQVHGEFRSTLDHWHMARQFAAEPALNSTFVTSVPRKDILQSPSTDACYMNIHHSIIARRLMQKKAG